MRVLSAKVAKVVFVGAVAVSAVVGLVLLYVFYGPNTFDGEKKIFVVSKGQTWQQIVDSLEYQGIIRSRTMFEFVVAALRRGKQAHVGRYEFASGISNVDIYENLRLGKSMVPIVVTLREGRRASAYARTLARSLGVDSARIMQLVNDEQFARSLGVDAKTLEGYLFPDTYFFGWQTDEEEILRRLVQQTFKIFNDSLRARAAELAMTIHDVLTLASIIEGEAFFDDERAMISGVYHNRLRKGMRLEADPTIQYIIPDGPRRLLHRDLLIENPYNTYRNHGLPPGPICSPSAASLRAALYPEQHTYYFFVADGKGGHLFATTYRQHLANVRKFRRERAEQLRSQRVS
ncbi:MAG TPA: endolytic transglycosylase MltG [Bacteroidota bacterium]|nr:endolytic transglycosylase MltG [Bacteroidota bacterium]